jgi:hypothetical protein
MRKFIGSFGSRALPEAGIVKIPGLLDVAGGFSQHNNFSHARFRRRFLSWASVRNLSSRASILASRFLMIALCQAGDSILSGSAAIERQICSFVFKLPKGPAMTRLRPGVRWPRHRFWERKSFARHLLFGRATTIRSGVPRKPSGLSRTPGRKRASTNCQTIV